MDGAKLKLKNELLELKHELKSCNKSSDYLFCAESIKVLGKIFGQEYTFDFDKRYIQACQSCYSLQKKYTREFKKNKLFLNDFYSRLIKSYEEIFKDDKPTDKYELLDSTTRNKILEEFIKRYFIEDINYISRLLANRTFQNVGKNLDGFTQYLYKNDPIIMVNFKQTLYDLQVLIHELGHAINYQSITSSKEMFQQLCLSDFSEYNSRFLELKFIDFAKKLGLNNIERLEYNYKTITYRYLLIMYVYTLLPKDCFDEYGNIIFRKNDIDNLKLDDQLLSKFVNIFTKGYCGNIKTMSNYAISSVLASITSNSSDLVYRSIKDNKVLNFNEDTFETFNLSIPKVEEYLVKKL